MNAHSQLLAHRTVERLYSGLFMCVLCLAQTAFAQNCADPIACNFNPDYVPSEYSIMTEVVSEDIGELVGSMGVTDLSGYSTTRIYFVTTNPNDFVSSVSGTSEAPSYVTTTTDFFHAAAGSSTANSINGVLFPVFPDLEYDSWVTIGIDAAPDAGAGEADVSTVQSAQNPWVSSFDLGTGAPGGNIEIDDEVGGAWFVLYGDSNGVPDSVGKVLLGQFTTTGEIGGNLQVQVFPNGDGNNFILFDGAIGQNAGGDEECEYLATYYLDSDGDGYGTTAAEMCGLQEGYVALGGDCNDNSAIAYPGNPEDLVGDGIDGDCDGSETCYRDIDNDGYRSADTTDFIGSPFNINCSEFGEAYWFDPVDCDDLNPNLTAADEDGNCLDLSASNDGCSDPIACNYDAEASAEEQNCDYLSCEGCGNPGACNYNPDATLVNNQTCEFESCAGCTDPEATNYNANAVSSNDGLCVYTGILAISPIEIEFNDDNGQVGLYTNDVYALLPPEAIQLNAVLGVKGGDIRLRVSPWGGLYQSVSCGGWTPSELGTTFVEVDGVVYTNDDCMNDSWFTIGGNSLTGPDLVPTGFDPSTVDDQAEFDSESLLNEGDTLGWRLASDEGGLPENRCAELQNRPGCQNAVRIARFTMPLGQSFSIQAGLTYTIIDGSERTVSGSEVTSDSDEVSSESGGGGEADSEDEYGEDGESSQLFGCTDGTACNYNSAADTENGTCDYESCVGCTYSQAGNYGEALTSDNGTCVFNGCTDPAYLEYSALANTDDGSCLTPLQAGCVDAGYLEFDEEANVADVNACLTLIVDGCVYADAANYDGSANRDDGSCQYEGCTDPGYFEYSAIANLDDGSCVTLRVDGCTDEGFLEFNASANVLDAAACVTAIIVGCTYEAAQNYSPASNQDNGACTFDFTPPTLCASFDTDESGAIGSPDLLSFLTLFGQSCE